MTEKMVTVVNPTGLHLRPAGMLCQTSMKFQSKILLLYKEKTINAKSVLSVLGACVKSGDEITFICEGPDEEQALRDMVALVESGLGE